MPNVQATKQQAIHEAWLLFFNQTLRNQGLINEEDYRRMGILIRKEAAAVAKTKSAKN